MNIYILSYICVDLIYATYIFVLILDISRQVDIATIIFILDFWNMYRSGNNGITLITATTKDVSVRRLTCRMGKPVLLDSLR